MSDGDLVPVDAPILEFDPSREAIIEAVAVPNIKHRNGTHAAMPSRVLLCFFQDVIRLAVAEYGAPVLTTLGSEIGPNEVYGFEHTGTPIALAHPGVGAPLAA